MASTVNPNTIDTAYPIAGQDNDSQGFRDNFTNIKTNFETVRDEINELHQKSVLKAAITGESLDNDLDGVDLRFPTLLNPRLKLVNYGSVSTGSTTLDQSQGSYHKLEVSGDIILAFSNIPASNTHTSIMVELNVISSTWNIVLDTPATILNGVSVRYFNNATKEFDLPPGDYLFEFVTSSQATEMYLVDHLYTTRRTVVPPTTVGEAGDTKGMVVGDASHIYVCIADYDGVTPIWVRSAAATW
jgi:hypothetical protein